MSAFGIRSLVKTLFYIGRMPADIFRDNFTRRNALRGNDVEIEKSHENSRLLRFFSTKKNMNME